MPYTNCTIVYGYHGDPTSGYYTYNKLHIHMSIVQSVSVLKANLERFKTSEMVFNIRSNVHYCTKVSWRPYFMILYNYTSNHVQSVQANLERFKSSDIVFNIGSNGAVHKLYYCVRVSMKPYFRIL